MSCELQCEDANLGMFSWQGEHDGSDFIWDLLRLHGRTMTTPWALEAKLDCQLARGPEALAQAAVDAVDWDGLSFAMEGIYTGSDSDEGA